MDTNWAVSVGCMWLLGINPSTFFPRTGTYSLDDHLDAQSLTSHLPI